MEHSAGLLLIYNNKILLCHPTNAPWKGTYSIPKGKIEEGEDKIEAAIRETKEEVGILISKEMINPNDEKTIEYRSKNGKLYKKVYYFPVYLNISFEEILPTSNLQIDEVDWAGFLDKSTASEKIFWRFASMLDFIE